MPYDIVKVKGGYKVKTKSGKYLSDKPLKLDTARDQAYAVALNEIKRGKIKNFIKGGKVEFPVGYDVFARKALGNFDIVPSILQPNEIVIPVKHAKKVEKFLKQEKIKLPNL